jgi:hypothetical protein
MLHRPNKIRSAIRIILPTTLWWPFSGVARMLWLGRQNEWGWSRRLKRARMDESGLA